MSANHTKLPWRYIPSGGPLNRAQVFGPPHPVDGGDYAALATLANPDDAALIVRAVNSHEALVAALEKCDKAFVSWQVGQIPGRPEDILALISSVRVTLAQAKGQP